MVTVFGKQEDAAVGYNPRYRGKRSYDPLLCIEANSSYLWDAELRPGNAATWDGAVEVLDTASRNVPPDIRQLRVRADAGFGFDPVFVALDAQPAQYAVVARLTTGLKRLLPGLSYHSVNRQWEMAEFEHCLHAWPRARRFVVARRFLEPVGMQARARKPLATPITRTIGCAGACTRSRTDSKSHFILRFRCSGKASPRMARKNTPDQNAGPTRTPRHSYHPGHLYPDCRPGGRQNGEPGHKPHPGLGEEVELSSVQ